MGEVHTVRGVVRANAWRSTPPTPPRAGSAWPVAFGQAPQNSAHAACPGAAGARCVCVCKAATRKATCASGRDAETWEAVAVAKLARAQRECIVIFQLRLEKPNARLHACLVCSIGGCRDSPSVALAGSRSLCRRRRRCGPRAFAADTLSDGCLLEAEKKRATGMVQNAWRLALTSTSAVALFFLFFYGAMSHATAAFRGLFWCFVENTSRYASSMSQ